MNAGRSRDREREGGRESGGTLDEGEREGRESDLHALSTYLPADGNDAWRLAHQMRYDEIHYTCLRPALGQVTLVGGKLIHASF